MSNTKNIDVAKPFSVEELLAAASAETGLNDFGSDEHIEALRQLVDSTNKDITLSAIGAMAFEADVHRLLVNRLRFADDLKRHPEILEENIANPIIIVGLPRTGTTKLQRMLSADPDTQSLHYWRLFNPAPFPGSMVGGEDPRIETARQTLGMMAQLAPGFMASHPTYVDQPDEETFLQLFTFKSVLTYLLHPAHNYFEWLKTQSRRDMYAYMKQLLQYLQWQDGGGVGKNGARPWIMKSPAHVENLDLLAEFFPSATIVFTHRDFNQTIASFCRLAEMSWGLKVDNLDLEAIGRMAVKLWSNELHAHLEQRKALGSSVNIIDVQYAQIRDDTIGVIREIYQRAGRELTPQREQEMLAWEAANPPGKFGTYSYSLEHYGLTPAIINEAFGEFELRFNH